MRQPPVTYHFFYFMHRADRYKLLPDHYLEKIYPSTMHSISSMKLLTRSLESFGIPSGIRISFGNCDLSHLFFRVTTSGFLQIPPHDGHPCRRLTPSHYPADSGLSPVRNVRRRAHKQQAKAGNTLTFACFSVLSYVRSILYFSFYFIFLRRVSVLSLYFIIYSYIYSVKNAPALCTCRTVACFRYALMLFR